MKAKEDVTILGKVIPKGTTVIVPTLIGMEDETSPIYAGVGTTAKDRSKGINDLRSENTSRKVGYWEAGTANQFKPRANEAGDLCCWYVIGAGYRWAKVHVRRSRMLLLNRDGCLCSKFWGARIVRKVQSCPIGSRTEVDNDSDCASRIPRYTRDENIE